MKEVIDFKSIRNTANASPSLVARIAITLGFQTFEQAWGSQSFGMGIVIPILAVLGLVVTGLTAVISVTVASFCAFGVLSVIVGQYQLRKIRDAIIESRKKLNTQLSALEKEVVQLMLAIQTLHNLIETDSIPIEEGENLKNTLVAKIAFLLDQLPGADSKIAKLQTMVGATSEEDLKNKLLQTVSKEGEDLNRQNQLKNGLAICLSELKKNTVLTDEEKQKFTTVLNWKLRRVPEDEKVNKHIDRLSHVATFLGGFSLGFGLSTGVAVIFAVSTIAALVTFPWILIPLGVGLVLASAALAVSIGIKKKNETEQAQLNRANAQLDGVQTYVKHIHQETNRKTLMLTEVHRSQKELVQNKHDISAQTTHLANVQTKLLEDTEKLSQEKNQLQSYEKELKQQSLEIQKNQQDIILEKQGIDKEKGIIIQQKAEINLLKSETLALKDQLNLKEKYLQEEQLKVNNQHAELVQQQQLQQIEKENLEKAKQEIEKEKQALVLQRQQLETQKLAVLHENTKHPVTHDVKYLIKDIAHAFADDHDHIMGNGVKHIGNEKKPEDNFSEEGGEEKLS